MIHAIIIFLLWLAIAFGWLRPATARPGRLAVRTPGPGGSWYWGVERSVVLIGGDPYLTRWILYLGPIGFRLHKFDRGDDDAAPHDHPFWFITIPLTHSYLEWVYAEHHGQSYFCDPVGRCNAEDLKWDPILRIVKRFRPSFRSSGYKHIVESALEHDRIAWSFTNKPFWTFCIFGFTNPDWGFWPGPNTFVHFTEFKSHNRDGVSHAVG